MENKKVRKLIIPVAGVGTRFLPATKAQPKAMMPILEKPTIQIIVEEAVKSGIKDIILVTTLTQNAIEDHFDRNVSLEQYCLQNGKREAYEKIRAVAELANFIYIRQKGRYGSGTPILNAKDLIGDEPFAVVFGDDIWDCPKKPQVKQLIEVFNKYRDPVISAYPTDAEGTKKYGIIEGLEIEKSVYQIEKLVEKPGPEKTKSRMAAISGYVLTPDIFDELEKIANKKTKEFYLTDAIAGLMKKRPVYAKVIDGTYHDIGSRLTWLKANIEFGLKDKEIGKDLRKFLRQKIK